MLFALKELTKQRRHEVVLARSGQEALAHLEGVDAVVTDYAMPEMDGVQLLQAIRERDESLPVILLTAHGSERIAVRAMKTGAYEYVTKPFDIEEMGLVIDRALEARALRMQNRRLTGRKARSSRSARDGSSTSTCVSSLARIAIWRRMRARAAFARTSTTGWPWWSSSCRRCTSIEKTSPPWRSSSPAATPSDSESKAPDFPPRSWKRCASRIGRVTCDNWRMPWRGSSRSAPAARSARRR